MDGGPPPHPGRPVARRPACGRPVSVRERADHRARDGDRHPPNGAFRGFGAPQTRLAAEMQVNRVAEALDSSPLDLRRRWCTASGDTTPTGQVLRESVAGIEVLEAAAQASVFDRAQAQTRAMREARTDGAGSRPASAWRSPGTGRAPPAAARRGCVGRLGRADRRRSDPRAHRPEESARGRRAIFPQLVAEALGVELRRWTAPQDTSSSPTAGRPSRRAPRSSSAGSSSVPRAAGATVEEQSACRSRRPRRRRAAARRRALHAVSGRAVRRQGLAGDAYRIRLGGIRRARRRRPRHRGGGGRDCVAADDAGRIIHPVLAKDQVEGARCRRSDTRRSRR